MAYDDEVGLGSMVQSAPRRGRDPTLALFALLGLTVVVLLGALGKLVSQRAPDTAGYLDLGQFPASLAKQRTPLYGWLVRLIAPRAPDDAWAILLLQLGCYAVAIVFLFVSLRRLGMRAQARLAICLPLFIASPVWLDSNQIVPEFLALALAIMAVAGCLITAVVKRPVLPLLATALATGCAYLLKPAYLPFIVVVPALLLIASKLYARRLRFGLAAACLLACAIPFLAVSTVRYTSLGSFNIVSFGGFQMAGLAALMLSPDVVERLPGDQQPLASQILDGREAGAASGTIMPFPRGSDGRPSYFAATPGHFDVLALMYDDVLYKVVNRLRQPGESWIAFDRRLQRFAWATVLAAPARYAAWVVGATTRFVGRALVTNPAFLLATAALAILYLRWLLCGSAHRPTIAGTDLDAIIAIVVLFTVGAGILSLLVTFPVGRYVDTAGIFLPALPLYAALRFRGHAMERAG